MRITIKHDVKNITEKKFGVIKVLHDSVVCNVKHR